MIVVVTFALNSLLNFAVGLLVAKFLGPEEFGRFALAMAVSSFVNAAAFDWIRLAATRFYGERSRRAEPQVRGSLDAAFAMAAAAVCSLALMGMVSGIRTQLSPALALLAIASGIAAALFDYHAALLRARFHDRGYARFVLTKNIAAFFLTVGGAFVLRSADYAVIGMCVSVVLALAAVAGDLRDPGATWKAVSRPLMKDYARYGLPIITAMVLYQLIPLANRALIAGHYGFAETGQFSLAFDIGLRIVQAIGSTLDVLLFQIAVQFDRTHGHERAREQVQNNMSVVFAVVLPASVGCWLALPSFEALVVPAQFRGPFGHYLGLMLPGLCAFGLVQYAINPVFQIAKRTLPLIAAALVACVVDVALVLMLPHSTDATALAVAQSGSLIAGAVTLLLIAAAGKRLWPRPRDVAVVLAGTATMTGLLLPLRGLSPGFAALGLQMCIGIVVMLGFGMVFDLAGLRGMMLGRLKARPA